ncbi:leucine-rich repeat domain-containing protein [Spongiivirga sp. MCCC 1A20706]|uniref:leucine-rich repeat domain-containing protein n=1 Tax=Spongiivirga sp. MCCC 1A20706 TaxID=3160963 RepID=UPI003977C75C
MSIVFLLFFSCEKEVGDELSNTTQKLPIKIVSLIDSSGTGDLVITNGNGLNTTYNELEYDKIHEIEVNLSAEGTYIFAIEDFTHGKIKMYASKETLENYTKENPFTLQFEHYKNQKIATFLVKSEDGPDLRHRKIDLTVNQAYGSLYHIDWGDGSEEIAEAPFEIQSPSDRIYHRYATSGEYTITLRTTYGEEVSGLNLQITANGKGDRIQTLELENLPNLRTLSLGDSDMINVDSVIEQYPELTSLSLRFGSLESIDLSKNPMLEGINITGNYNTIVKGISSLTNLKGLGVTGNIENLNLALFPDLLSLTIRGHKIGTLDLSANPKLTLITLQLNDLDEINLSATTNLRSLFITNNNLTGLDLSNNKQIEYLNLSANYINEIDLTQQDKLKYLNLSSIFIKQVAAPESLDHLALIDLAKSRFLNEVELLDAVFKGQENNPKTNGQIIFHELANVLERQVILLNQLVTVHDWVINVPE